MTFGTGGVFTQEMMDRLKESINYDSAWKRPESKSEKKKAIVFVAISEKGHVVEVAEAYPLKDDAMELVGLRHICDQLDQRIRLRHKQLVISPQTTASPENFKWSP